MENEQLNIGETSSIIIKSGFFLNKAFIKETLWDIRKLKGNYWCSYSDFIDQDVLEILQDFKDTRSKDKNWLNLIGLKKNTNWKTIFSF